jgi:hypothetical protein
MMQGKQKNCSAIIPSQLNEISPRASPFKGDGEESNRTLTQTSSVNKKHTQDNPFVISHVSLKIIN